MRIIDIAYMRLSARVAYVRPWELKYLNFVQQTGEVRFNLANQLHSEKVLGQQYNTIHIFPLFCSPLVHSGLMDDTTIFNDRMEISIRPVRSIKAVLVEDSLYMCYSARFPFFDITHDFFLFFNC